MEQQLQDIMERNKRVEMDKAWETSFARRGFIAIITYGTAIFFLWLIGNPNPFVHGLVPVGGFLLSTLSLPSLKRWWMRMHSN